MSEADTEAAVTVLVRTERIQSPIDAPPSLLSDNRDSPGRGQKRKGPDEVCKRANFRKRLHRRKSCLVSLTLRDVSRLTSTFRVEGLVPGLPEERKSIA